jgi:hypothetical protein
MVWKKVLKCEIRIKIKNFFLKIKNKRLSRNWLVAVPPQSLGWAGVDMAPFAYGRRRSKVPFSLTANLIIKIF